MKKLIFILFLGTNILLGQTTSVIKVEGMHCPLCTTAVKKAIKNLDGIEQLSVRLNTKEVNVTYNEKTNLKEILEAIKTTSYEGVVLSTSKN